MPTFTKSQYELISSILWCLPEDIHICDDAAGGMTNSSILIDVKSKKYIVRLPGKGSKELINRSQEYRVYNFLHNLKYDNLTVFISPDGMKITKYITNPRNCDPNNANDVRACMQALRDKSFGHLQVNNLLIYNIFICNNLIYITVNIVYKILCLL